LEILIEEKVPSFLFAELIDEHGEAVYKFCRSLTYSAEDADDLFQETFLRAFEHSMDNTAFPQGFLFSTALYTWKKWKTKYARRNRIAPIIPLDEKIPANSDVEASVMVQEEARAVREAVDSLPEKFKIPTILHYTMDMSIQDIALTMELPEGTVKSRLHKARKLIKEGMIELGYGK
jgi:RNA polymerase sigma-70 factor (ECF subfamily)